MRVLLTFTGFQDPYALGLVGQKGLRAHIRPICDDAPGAELFIAVASGTPQMHACWVLLAASGEITAHLLHVRPPRFVSKERPLVSEIDLTSPVFPIVRVALRETEVPYIEQER